MAKNLQIPLTRARSLLVSMGITSAADQEKERVEKKINNLVNMLDDDAKAPTEAKQELLDRIIAANNDDIHIELTEEEQEEAPKKVTKKPVETDDDDEVAETKPAKKSAPDDDDDDDDDEPAPKKKTAPAAEDGDDNDGDGEQPAKRGRGRPKLSPEEKAKKEAEKAKAPAETKPAASAEKETPAPKPACSMACSKSETAEPSLDDVIRKVHPSRNRLYIAGIVARRFKKKITKVGVTREMCLMADALHGQPQNVEATAHEILLALHVARGLDQDFDFEVRYAGVCGFRAPDGYELPKVEEAK